MPTRDSSNQTETELCKGQDKHISHPQDKTHVTILEGSVNICTCPAASVNEYIIHLHMFGKKLVYMKTLRIDTKDKCL